MNLWSCFLIILSTVAFPKIFLPSVLCHVVEETNHHHTRTNFDEDADHINNENYEIIRGQRKPMANIIYYPMMLYNKVSILTTIKVKMNHE